MMYNTQLYCDTEMSGGLFFLYYFLSSRMGLSQPNLDLQKTSVMKFDTVATEIIILEHLRFKLNLRLNRTFTKPINIKPQTNGNIVMYEYDETQHHKDFCKKIL